MPRIDPHQLLTCLTVLLTPTGGILSKNEVQRLANLMTKFSKKLVSKCVYVLILKNTELPLLGAFMVEGGWNLVHVWLQDGYNNKNWALVSELLELLLMSPTTVEQLKTNNLPKLVKSLSKREDLEKVKDLANQLVQKWLKIVKEDQNQNTQTAIERLQAQQSANTVVVSQPVQVVDVPLVQVEQAVVTEKASPEREKEPEQPKEGATSPSAAQACYKLAVRDGKHILCKVPASEANVTVVENAIIEDITPAEELQVEKESSGAKEEKETENRGEKEVVSEKRKEKSNHDRHKSKSSKSSSSSRSKDKDRKSSSSSSSRDKSRDRSRSSSKSKDRSSSKDKSRSDKHRSNGSVKSSSGRDNNKDKKESKEKQAEKDKDTLTKIQPPTLQKIGRIPKKTAEEKEEKKEESKKPSFSIEVRKSSEEKPKTVKVYNAKMRSTGLLEEAKPPPPRPVKKTPPALPAIPPPKRPSPVRDLIPPPEKKVKVEPPVERPGAIKLIPPKPKPPVLQESDIFMDALAASASTKKEPKKRKRRISTSKESTTSSPPTSPSVSTALTNGVPTTTTTATTQMTLRGITPANFYQDTLETTDCADDDKPKEEEERISEETTNENPPTPTDNEEKMEVTEKTDNIDNGDNLKGVLVHVRKKGPKKTLKWKPESELVEVQYFELDETERVNVSKPFGDMARMEITSEKHALQLRKVQNDDNMGVQIPWRPLIEIDLKPRLAEPGCKSLEKDIQFAREKSFIGMSPLMHRYAETPAEPDAQQYQVTDPVIIPLEDPENTDQDAPSQPWPEPKGSPPQVPMQNMPPIFPNIQAPFQNFGGPPPAFQNVPFSGPNFGPPPNMMVPGGPNVVPPPGNPHEQWNNPMNNPMNAPMNNGPMMPPNCPPEMINQGPPMFPPKHPDNFNQNMNEFPPHFNQPNMFPQNNFNMRGRGGFRGGRGGNGPWVRMNGPGPGPGGWNHRGGGMNRGGRVCKNVKNFGYCRNRDSCPFFHPN